MKGEWRLDGVSVCGGNAVAKMIIFPEPRKKNCRKSCGNEK
jgi:hypothetical protein